MRLQRAPPSCRPHAPPLRLAARRSLATSAAPPASAARKTAAPPKKSGEAGLALPERTRSLAALRRTGTFSTVTTKGGNEGPGGLYASTLSCAYSPPPLAPRIFDTEADTP